MTAPASLDYDVLLRATLALSAQREPAQLGRTFLQFAAEVLGGCEAMLYDLVSGTSAGFSLKPAQGLALHRRVGTEREGSFLHGVAAQMLASGSAHCAAAPLASGAVAHCFLIALDATRHQWLIVHGVSRPEHARLVSDCAAVYRQCYALQQENCTDALTGLYNRKPFIARMHEILSEQTQGNGDSALTRECVLGVIDVDRFKRINDRFGHLIGDEVLLLVSRLLRDSFRSTDLLFRFGGEEFVALLPNTRSEAAAKVFERFRRTIAAHVFPQVGEVTASIGFTRVCSDRLPMSFVDEADRALYHAKQLGRNRVCNFSDLTLARPEAADNGVELF